MSWLRLVWRGLSVTAHILLGVILTALFARRVRSSGAYRHNPYVVSWWHERLLRIMRLEVQVVGARPQAPALLVSNHVSWLDIPVLGSLTHTCFLSKDEVRRWPVVGWLAAAAGTLFIARGGGQASAITRAIASRLEGDRLLTLFPEGTTTDGSDVRPFFSRLFGAAIETGSQVVPVALRYHVHGEPDLIAPYTGDQTLVANLVGVLKRKNSEVRVTFGEPLDMRDLTRKSAAETTRNAVRAALCAPLDDAPDAQRRRVRPHTG